MRLFAPWKNKRHFGDPAAHTVIMREPLDFWSTNWCVELREPQFPNIGERFLPDRSLSISGSGYPKNSTLAAPRSTRQKSELSRSRKTARPARTSTATWLRLAPFNGEPSHHRMD